MLELSLFTFVLQGSKETSDVGALQKGQDFVKAFILGFEVEVCLLGAVTKWMALAYSSASLVLVTMV